MHPQAATLWRGPLWTLALLLAGLSSLGPFAIDTYLPAFPGMAADLSASAVQMQQTLSTYLFGFALMNLFHGALSDSLGRRPVVLVAMAVFTLPHDSAGPQYSATKRQSAAAARTSAPGKTPRQPALSRPRAAAAKHDWESEVLELFGDVPKVVMAGGR